MECVVIGLIAVYGMCLLHQIIYLINELKTHKNIIGDLALAADRYRVMYWCMEMLAKYNKQIHVLRETRNDHDENVCPVCLDALGSVAVSLDCGHRYHTQCVIGLVYN